MHTPMFAVILTALLAVPAFFYARRADKRGLILIMLAVLVAADIWVVQTSRMQTAVTVGGKLADLAILTAFGYKVGVLDIAVSVAIIATFAAITNFGFTLCVIVSQALSFYLGLSMAKVLGIPLPGAVFFTACALPFVWITRKTWGEMPRGDKVQTAVVCGLCLVASVAGIIKAVSA